jgi:hypothetical protein
MEAPGLYRVASRSSYKGIDSKSPAILDHDPSDWGTLLTASLGCMHTSYFWPLTFSLVWIIAHHFHWWIECNRIWTIVWRCDQFLCQALFLTRLRLQKIYRITSRMVHESDVHTDWFRKICFIYLYLRMMPRCSVFWNRISPGCIFRQSLSQWRNCFPLTWDFSNDSYIFDRL